MKFFSYDGSLMRFFNRLFDLMVLSIIWWISCIPIVTIGAATTALYDTSMTLTKKDIKPFKYYRQSFRRFWKPSTICWIIYFVIGIAVAGDFIAFNYNWPQYLTIVRVITGFLVITLAFSLMLVFPVISTFEGNIREYMFNAFVLSFMYAPLTLLMILIIGAVVYIALKAFSLLFIVLLLGPGVAAFINAYILRFIFRKYLPEDDPKY